MKILKIATGEIRHGYEYEDLDPQPQAKVLEDAAEFLTIVAENEEEAENSRDESYVIDFIKANDYLFDEDGNQLPITYHYSDNKFVKATFGKKEHDVEIIDNPEK